MTRPGRVLIVDDEARWRDALVEILTGGGFHAEAALTTEEAQTRLAASFFHLLVLDIRMVDSDPSNVEGMGLLEKVGETSSSKAFGIIMLSAYGTTEQMREAFSRHGVNDFLRKQDFSGEAFLNQVRRLFGEGMKINLDLRCTWQDGLTAKEAVVNLEVEGTRVRRGGPQQTLLADELEDLLCRLFFTADTLLLKPLAKGASGAGVLLAQPFSGDGGALPVVVKFGDYRQIDREFRNYERFVRPFVGGSRVASAQAPRRTMRMGGILYSLLGGASDRFEDFASFYRRADAATIAEAIDHLFFGTCGAWYASLGQVKPLDLTASYTEWLTLNPEGLEEAMAGRLKTVEGRDFLHFRSLTVDRRFGNPISILRRSHVVLPTYETITHGDLSEHNILLDGEKHSWLIDFQKTGYGHILRDVIQLDTMVRLHLLEVGEASLDERLALEEALCVPESFAEAARLESTTPPAAPGLHKAFATCAHLRAVAARLVASHPGADIRELYVGVLYCALKVLRSYSVPLPQREHAMLSASVLAERLTP